MEAGTDYSLCLGKERQELRRQAVDQATAEIKGMGFAVPAEKGCIHSDESRRFVRQVLKGGEWQEKVLEQGFYPAFKSHPGQYRERNNASAVKEMETVWEKVEEWKQQGAIMQFQEPAWCTSPLSVAAKWDTQAGKMKKRVVLDLSRHVNLHTEQYTVRMDDLQATEGTRQQDDYGTVFDLENQFFHVKLAPEAYKFFGFAVPDKEGTERYYCFKVMVYGFAPAVAVVTRLVRPIQAYLHERGIKTCMFVDDNNVGGETQEETERAMNLALMVYRLAGWNIQWKKTTTSAEQKIRYLGVEVNTERMEYRLPKDKEDKVLEDVTREWKRGISGEKTAARETAELLGKLASCRTTHGPVLHITSREMQHQLGMATQEGNWNARFVWTEEAVEELQWIKENLKRYNGRNLRQEECTDKIYKQTETAAARNEARVNRWEVEQAAKKLQEGTVSYIYTTAKESKEVENVQESGQRWIEEGLQELRAIVNRLQRDKQQLRKVVGGRVYWMTSSVNGYKFLKGGARQKEVQYWAKEVRRLEKSMRITVVPLWVGPGQGDGPVIQRGGGASTDEWSVRDEWLHPVLYRFNVQPTVDAMATAENTKCAKFFSKGPQPGSAGVDFFAQRLESNEVYYCCPPVKLAAHCIRKIRY